MNNQDVTPASVRVLGAVTPDGSIVDQELVIDPAVGHMHYAWGRSIPLDDLRDHGAFGPEIPVPASAPIVDRLVGLLGRQP